MWSSSGDGYRVLAASGGGGKEVSTPVNAMTGSGCDVHCHDEGLVAESSRPVVVVVEYGGCRGFS